MGIDELLGGKRDEILRAAAGHRSRMIHTVGSVARGEADERSDVDFLVELEPGRTLFDLGGLLMDLRDLLGREAYVVTEGGLEARIRSHIPEEALAL